MCSFLRAPRTCLIVVIAFAAAAAGCAASAPPRLDTLERAPIVLPNTLRVRASGRIVAVPIEEYVLGTALSEVSPVGEAPDTVAGIFRLQAILARTYAAWHIGRHRQEGFDVCDTTHCQLYEPRRIETSRFSAAARRAVAETSGRVLTFGARLAEALFHSDCGGHTADAVTIWGSRAVPYLVGTPDRAPDGTHRRWQFRVSADRLRQAFNASPLSAVGDRLTSVRIVERDAGERAARIEIKGNNVEHVLRGEQVRVVLNQTFGPTAIRSTRFDVTRARDEYQFDGTGFGHGVGLCQVGAAARLRRGESVDAVLSAYFAGASVMRVR